MLLNNLRLGNTVQKELGNPIVIGGMIMNVISQTQRTMHTIKYLSLSLMGSLFQL